MKFKCQVWVWVAVVAFLLMGYASASGKSIRGSRHLYVASSVSQWRQPGVAPHRAAPRRPVPAIVGHYETGRRQFPPGLDRWRHRSARPAAAEEEGEGGPR